MYTRAIEADPYMAISYFQRANALFYVGELDDALLSYQKCLKLLLNNDYIDYTQLGMNFKLYRCEIVFNVALCFERLGEIAKADDCIAKASSCATTPEQKQIINNSSTQNIFSVPRGMIFDVKELKKNNLSTKAFLKDGKIALDSTPAGSGFNGFIGATMLSQLENQATTGTLVRRLKNETNKVDRRNSFGDAGYTNPKKMTHKRNVSSPDIREPIAGRSNNTEVSARTVTQSRFTRKSSLPKSSAPKMKAPHNIPDQIQEFENGYENFPQERSYEVPVERFPQREIKKKSSISDSPKSIPYENEFDYLAFELPKNPDVTQIRPKITEPHIHPTHSASHSTTSSSNGEKIKIKVDAKAIGGKALILMVHPHVTFKELIEKIKLKLKLSNNVSMNYYDDDSLISITDQEDLDVYLESNSNACYIINLTKD
ncbi:hypothetical protein BC833DRAFT_572686 [Globomyces pollinis-pini]|nr:hypothetical protein BC833DRAFT_572686 [Globomyces pollinis-pini]